MKLRNLFGGISQFTEIIAILILLECIINSVCEKRHRKRHSHNHRYHNGNINSINSIDIDSNANDRKILIGGKGGRVEWSGRENTTCSLFSNYREFSDSQCSSIAVHKNQNITAEMESGLHNAGRGSENSFWHSCQGNSCSIIYEVISGTKLKFALIHGYVDTKAEVIILAEYATDRGNLYQIGKRRFRDYNNSPESSSLKNISFQYVHEEFLDVTVLNVTMVLNGGFSMIDNFTIILEEKKQTQHTEPIVEEIVLDRKQDEQEREWYEVTCHYSQFFEEFWTFGCPVDADSNALPPGNGFWFPCRESSCNFFYDGTSQGKPTVVKIEGYLQGGSISLAGKSQMLSDSGWRDLGTKILRNSTVSYITFDLSHVCNIHILKIEALLEKDSIILIDKIIVQVDPHQNSSSCSMNTATENTKDLEVSYRTSGAARHIPKHFNFVLMLLLCTILWQTKSKTFI